MSAEELDVGRNAVLQTGFAMREEYFDSHIGSSAIGMANRGLSDPISVRVGRVITSHEMAQDWLWGLDLVREVV